MRAATLRAFRDELQKIAMAGPVDEYHKPKPGLRGMWDAGWHGVGPEGSMGRQTWMGQGRATAGERAAMGPIGRGLDTVTSLGDQGPSSKWRGTRHLPIGAKSMIALSTAAQAKSALQAEDPTGQGRSRTERVTGVAGGAMGGIMGTGALLRTRWGQKHPIISNLVGGIGGTMVGEKAVSLPWHGEHVRARRLAAQQAAQQQAAQQMPQPQVVQQPVVRPVMP